MLLYVGELKGGSGPLREGRTKLGLWHLFPPGTEAEMSILRPDPKFRGKRVFPLTSLHPLYSRYIFTFFPLT